MHAFWEAYQKRPLSICFLLLPLASFYFSAERGFTDNFLWPEKVGVGLHFIVWLASIWCLGNFFSRWLRCPEITVPVGVGAFSLLSFLLGLFGLIGIEYRWFYFAFVTVSLFLPHSNPIQVDFCDGCPSSAVDSHCSGTTIMICSITRRQQMPRWVFYSIVGTQTQLAG